MLFGRKCKECARKDKEIEDLERQIADLTRRMEAYTTPLRQDKTAASKKSISTGRLAAARKEPRRKNRRRTVPKKVIVEFCERYSRQIFKLWHQKAEQVGRDPVLAEIDEGIRALARSGNRTFATMADVPVFAEKVYFQGLPKILEDGEKKKLAEHARKARATETWNSIFPKLKEAVDNNISTLAASFQRALVHNQYGAIEVDGREREIWKFLESTNLEALLYETFEVQTRALNYVKRRVQDYIKKNDDLDAPPKDPIAFEHWVAER